MATKVFVLTKDEYDLIEDFLRYYGFLFGFQNIVIVDNGSTDPRVLAVYDTYIPKGVTLIHEPRPFHEATTFMTEHIRNMAPTDWCFLLETDEFLYWTPNPEEAIDPNTIHHYLAQVPKDVTYLRYEKFLGSIVNPSHLQLNEYIDGACVRPAATLTEFYDQNWDKIIVRGDAFVAVQQWPHQAEVSYGRREVCRELGLLHFHQTGKRRLLEKACKVLESIGVSHNIMGRFRETPVEVIQEIQAFLDQRASHGHKALYVLDVLYRAYAWHLFLAVHNIAPCKEFVATIASANTSITCIQQAVGTWKEGDSHVGDAFMQCIFVEDPREVEYCIHSVAVTLRNIS